MLQQKYAKLCQLQGKNSHSLSSMRAQQRYTVLQSTVHSKADTMANMLQAFRIVSSLQSGLSAKQSLLEQLHWRKSTLVLLISQK